jgi:hypothetical protein
MDWFVIGVVIVAAVIVAVCLCGNNRPLVVYRTLSVVKQPERGCEEEVVVKTKTKTVVTKNDEDWIEEVGRGTA